MIDFTCGGCEKKYSVPDEYGGKKARCKQCSHTNTIPSNGPVETAESLIVFSCQSCDKKIKVKQEHAGKRVRCPKCASVCNIPSPKSDKPEPVEQAIAFDESPDEWEDFDSGDEEFGFDDDLSALAADAESAPQSQIEISDRPVPKVARRSPRSSDSSEGLMAFAKGAGKIPLSLGASVLFTVGGAIGWMLIVKMISGDAETDRYFRLNFLAIAVASLAGVGLVVLTEKRNVFFGLLAVMIGFCGIICGKALIGKYVIQPKFDHIMASESEELFTNEPEFYIDLASDDMWVFAAQCYSMKEQGKLEDDLVFPTVMAYIENDSDGEESMEDTPVFFQPINLSPERQELVEQAKDQAASYIDSLGETEREVLTMKYGPEMYSDLMNFMAQRTPLSAVISFLATFGLFDLLFIPMGLWSAFKIGIGRD